MKYTYGSSSKRLIAAFSLFFLLSGCYVLKQGNKQLALLSDRMSFEDAVSYGHVEAQEEVRLSNIGQIRAFASKRGLKTGRSYTAFIPMERKEISFLIYAAKPYEMKLKKWKFPIIGSVPYKGYFEKKDRDKLARRMEEDEYETYSTYSTAFSFLGFIPDPVYQSMLSRSHLSLAHLIFHELTHKTFWLPKDVPFNENMAEFIAERMTEQYAGHYGLSTEFVEYKKRRENRVKFGAWLRTFKADLEKIYDSGLGAEETEKQKQISIAKNSDAGHQLLGKGYGWIKKAKWTNPRILSSLVYLPKLEPFERSYACWHSKSKVVNGTFTAGKYLKAIKLIKGKEGLVRLSRLSEDCK